MLEALVAKKLITGGMAGFLGTFGKPILVLIAIALAVAFIDQRGFNRAKEQDRKAELERAAIVAAIVGKIDDQLDQRLATISKTLGGKLATIDKERTIVQPIITRELARDPRLGDPSSCLSPELLRAVNGARGYPTGAELGEAGSANSRAVQGSGGRH
jgi:hypothetical protein